jgi:VCBS repeat-containing protein
VLLSVKKNDLWVADRNFCVLSFVNGIDGREGFFAIRKHGKFPYECLGKEKKVGKTETGTVYEQWINVNDDDGTIKKYRLIR